MGIVNYLGKLSPMTAEVCKIFRRLIQANAAWTWNRLYQNIYERIKSLVKEDMCMKYCSARKPFYLETDASWVGLGKALLQVKDNCYVRQCKLWSYFVLDFFNCLGLSMCYISLYGALSLHKGLSLGSLVFTCLGRINKIMY